MKIAKRAPAKGAPVINLPSVFGASAGKDFLLRIPVIGERPVTINVSSEHEGLAFDGKVIRGNCAEVCEFTVAISAENSLGKSEKLIHFKIGKDTTLLTPLLGFTTWNAFREDVCEKDILDTAQKLCDTGLADYGYSYVNIDSGWQKEYGGKYNAIMPSEKFPDMKKLCDTLHSLGFKCGIYSTPMLTAWGCPASLPSIPGCTVGEPDPRYPNAAMPIGKTHLEKNNVRQWSEWGFDYLKYDWAPADAENARLMKEALLESEREFAYCITTRAQIESAEFYKNNVNSWRDNEDSDAYWDNVKERFFTFDKWLPHINPGHFYDLDMLEICGIRYGKQPYALSTDEEVFTYTLRAFFMSPIQISANIDNLTDTELDILCNEEIIAINQDALCDVPKLTVKDGGLFIYERKLSDGCRAVAVFNTDDVSHTVELSVPEGETVRDIWAKEDLSVKQKLKIKSDAHTALVYKITK